MHAVKTMIKKTARYFGVEVKRYVEHSKTPNLFDCWVNELQTIEPVRVVFDVGANRGQTVADFRRKFPKSAIYAFEPGVPAYSELRAATANDPKTRPFNMALGEHDGAATLHENADDVTNSLLRNSPNISQFAPPQMVAPRTETTVPLMRIDTFCEKEAIGCIDLLKIDAQGYERHILNGAGSLLAPSRIRGLFIEVLFVDLYENQTWCDEVMELLRSRGYRLFGFTNVSRDEAHGWKWADAMFIGNS